MWDCVSGSGWTYIVPSSPDLSEEDFVKILVNQSRRAIDCVIIKGSSNRKCGAVVYLTEGSGKTREKTNNTPHPYDSAYRGYATYQYMVMSVFVYSFSLKNLPDFQ